MTPSSDFVQQEPRQGAPATHRTELWVFFDDRNVCTSPHASGRRPSTSSPANCGVIRGNIWSNNDSVSVVLDTFLDRRTAYFLQTTPIGAIRDGFLPDENRNTNLDVDLVWDVRGARFDGGWMTEIAVPFKSLRYPAGREQVWGFNVLRMERKINQASSWSPLPASYGGSAIFKVSSAGTVVGIKRSPMAASSICGPMHGAPSLKDRQAASTAALGDGAFGFDAQFKATKSINFDVSCSTDFAQVEVDNQQLNLTRFSLFYPKRAFFLEGQSNFTFGSTITSTQPGSDAPIFFFSRQIGLAEGRTVPINLAGRLMGRAGAFTIGAMTVQTAGAATR